MCRTLFINESKIIALSFTCFLLACAQPKKDKPPHDTSVDIIEESTRQDSLKKRIVKVCEPVKNNISLVIKHMDNDDLITINAQEKKPLFSVYKLPLAIVLLKDVAAGKISLQHKILVTPDDVSPGSKFNTDLWKKPVKKTVKELLELSIIRSDNTSSNKLVELLGGEAALLEAINKLGFSSFDVVKTPSNMLLTEGSANDMGNLLSQLHTDKLLPVAQKSLLLNMMRRARTGEKRLPYLLSKTTDVAHKTGTGPNGMGTNDVGIIKLPENKGHLIIAVLISESKLPEAEQEEIIASIAKSCFDFYTLH